MRRWLILGMIGMLLSNLVLVSAQDAAPTATPDPATEVIAEPTLEPIELDPLLGIPTIPPLDITLPAGWQLALRDTYTYRDMISDGDGDLETLPIDVYVGPVTGGLGWIVMLWGYDTLLPVSQNMTEEEYRERSAWLNGLRMLQSVVFDAASCNIGTAPQRDYTVGELDAVGTQFSVVDCDEGIPDTRGWFAALNIDNLNFAFFAYADPIQPAGGAFEFELQAILDTVDFRVDEITISAQDFDATRQAITLTPRAPMQMSTLVPTPTP